MQRALTELSRGGPIAFVETDYFEGRGAQAATAFVNGEVVAASECKEGEGWPINEALRAIGVVRAADELDTVCLGKFQRRRTSSSGAPRSDSVD